jgi:hypothetical protein
LRDIFTFQPSNFPTFKLIMTIRPFDWRDLPALYRYRNQSVFLYSALVLTRGPLLMPGALLSSLMPAMGIFTSVSSKNGDTDQALIGQILHIPGSQFAQLTFLAPDAALESGAILPLLDYLASQAGERGAYRLVADVDERTTAFEALRRASYAIYTRQRIWRLKEQVVEKNGAHSWLPANDRDLIAVRSLYYNLVPGLVQQVEPFPTERLHGFVYRDGEDLLAYVEMKYGSKGIWAQPFVHPDAEEIPARLVDLLKDLPSRRSRPVYICVRSYQAWLEPALEDLGAECSPRQAVMVKHLAIQQKAARSFALPALEGGHAEISAPFVRLENQQDS